MAAPHVIDVTESNFQKEVVERSVSTPVLLDFWASWCGPCKQLTPVLEKLAEEYGGGFVLGKIDTEAELALSQAFQVQSIPFVVLLVGGRPADAFAGAVGEAELRSFLDRHKITPLAAAAEGEEPMVPADVASLAAARSAALQGDVAAARDALEGFPEQSTLLPECENLLAGLEFLETEWPVDGEAGSLLGRARELFLAGQFESALQAIVASAQVDRGFADGMARRAMRLCQGALELDEMVDDYRRQLATLLY